MILALSQLQAPQPRHGAEHAQSTAMAGATSSHALSTNRVALSGRATRPGRSSDCHRRVRRALALALRACRSGALSSVKETPHENSTVQMVPKRRVSAEFADG